MAGNDKRALRTSRICKSIHTPKTFWKNTEYEYAEIFL